MVTHIIKGRINVFRGLKSNKQVRGKTAKLAIPRML